MNADRVPSDIALDFAGRLARGFVVGCNVLGDDGEPLTETQRVTLLTHLFLCYGNCEQDVAAMVGGRWPETEFAALLEGRAA